MKAIYTIHNFAKRLAMVLAVGFMAVNALGVNWNKVANLSEISNGDSVIVVIQDGKTLTSGQAFIITGTTTANSTDVTITSNSYISNPGNNIKWAMTKSSDTYTFKNGSVYLSSGSETNTNTNAVSNNDYNNWYITKLSDGYFKVQITSSSGRYLSWKGTCFGKYTDNFRNQISTGTALAQYDGAISFYKKESGYAVTYNNGGHGTAPSSTTATSVTLSAITGVTGYTCTGWKANVAVTVGGVSKSAGTLLTNGSTATLSGATTFTAQWSANNYTITLDDGDGSGGDGTIAVTYDANTNLTSGVTVPTLEHFDFGGYYTGENGTGTQIIDANGDVVASVTNYTSSTKQWIKADDVTLYAKWTEHGLKNYRTVCVTTYDITLDKNGGDADGSATIAANGTQLADISAPTKTGYKVEGYYAESGKTTLVAAADGTLEADVEVSSTDWTDEDGKWVLGDDATFYAKWEPISYEVRFNSNDENYLGDASGSMSNESYDYGESKKLTDNAFSLTGYTFAGWATTSDGDVEYDDKESVSNLSSTDGAVVDLYAIWTANKYTLTLSASGETSSVGDQTVQATYGSSMPLVTTADGTPAVVDPSKTGYTFDGWEYNSTQYYSYDVGEDEISSAHVWDVANTATLTPRWNVNSYTLTWNLAGGTVTEAGTGAAVDATGTPSSSVNYGASITAPTVTKAGYTFAGWDVTPASTMPASNTTYTATWTEKTVTGWTFTNHRGGATITSDPIVIYVGQKVRMDIAYLPADVLSTHTVKENYAYTRSDGNSYLIQEAKASAYFTFSGKAAKSSTSITFTHTEDTSDPKAFAKTVNVEIRALPTDTYLDLVHGISFSGPYGATLIDSDYGVQFTYTAPGGDVSDWSSSYANTCEQYHVHLIGWVESTWADEHLGDAEMPDTDDIISSGYYHPVGETMTVSGKTYYAVWAKVE